MLRLAVDLTDVAGARGPEVSIKKKAPISWFQKFSFKRMPMSQK